MARLRRRVDSERDKDASRFPNATRVVPLTHPRASSAGKISAAFARDASKRAVAAAAAAARASTPAAAAARPAAVVAAAVVVGVVTAPAVIEPEPPDAQSTFTPPLALVPAAGVG